MERPYVHINCASTLDGKISRPDGSRLRISCREDMIRVHGLRKELGSVLVGANTIINDDPKLTVKPSYVDEASPITKIVIDGRGKVPAESRFMRTDGSSLVLTSEQADPLWLEDIRSTVNEEGLDLDIIMMKGNDGVIDPEDILSELHSRGVEGVLVEGGSTIIRQFLTHHLYDRFTVYVGPIFTGGDGPSIIGREPLEDPLSIEMISSRRLGPGILIELS